MTLDDKNAVIYGGGGAIGGTVARVLWADGDRVRRLPTLREVAEVAAFLASDAAGAMTATVANLMCGALPD